MNLTLEEQKQLTELLIKGGFFQHEILVSETREIHPQTWENPADYEEAWYYTSFEDVKAILTALELDIIEMLGQRAQEDYNLGLED